MKIKIIQIVISCFVAFFSFGLVISLEAASPSYEPPPLRNQALMFEMSGSGSQQIKLDVTLKKRTAVKKQLFTKKQPSIKKHLFVKKQPAIAKQAELPNTLYRNKIWKVEGKRYDIPLRYKSKELSAGSLPRSASK